MAKIHDILGLVEYEAKEISRSPQDWMKYLDTSSKLYRYSFSDTLLIHAQRPDAVACAELELWNEKMNRWVNRGAKGIALIDDSGPRRRLRYVFDISDTHPVRGGRTPYLWQIQDQHRVPLLDHLTDTYGLEGDDSADIQNALLSISADMADENLEEAIEGMEYELENSFLEGLDEDTIRVEFRNLLMNSAFYTLSRRCGLDPMEYLEEEDFFGITDFNSLSVLTFLGNATSQIVEPVLRDIGRTIRSFSMEEMQKTVANDIGMPYNKFNTLIRESEKNEGGTEHGTDISSQRGLPVPEPDHTGRTDDNREIRDASEDISEGEQEELVSEHDADRETEQPSAGDRESSRGENGDSDDRVTGEIPGSGQEDRPNGMDSTHEQSDSDGRRKRAEGIGIQLTEEEPDLSEAEENIASALSLPELPSVERQIRSIEERAAALYAGEIPIPADVVDEVLRTGINRDRSQLRIIYNYMIEQEPEDYVEFLKNEYGTGGKGFKIDGTEYSVWFDELGMQIAVGHTVYDQILDKAFLSWEDISTRVKQLLDQGEYAPQSVLDAARDNAVKEHAQALAYMHGDMAEGVSEIVFGEENDFGYVYPEKTDKIEKLITQPEYLDELNERLEGLAEAYETDPSVMRFHMYRPDKVLARFQKFAKEAIPYQAREGFQWREQEIFITQDEIDAYLARGSSYSDGRLTIYAYFIQDKSDKEKADFLKEHYGTGGQSHALSGADRSNADYSAKGLKLSRGSYGKPDAEVLLKWPAVAKRVQYLIDNDNFLKAKDYSRMPSYEREKMASKVISFYVRLPKDIERPFKEDFFWEESRKDLVPMLEDEQKTEELLGKMDAALSELPLDFEDYEKKTQLLMELHGYAEGTYTLFPPRNKEAEVKETRQLSLFDFLDTSAFSSSNEQPSEVSEPVVDENAQEENIPDLEQPELEEEEEQRRFEEAKELWEDGYIYEDYVLSSETGRAITEAMDMTGVTRDDFSADQLDVIRTAAEKELALEPMLNPSFSPEQMQLISDVMERMSANEKHWFQREIDELTATVMTPEEINVQRRERNLPLEDFSEGMEEVPE